MKVGSSFIFALIAVVFACFIGLGLGLPATSNSDLYPKANADQRNYYPVDLENENPFKGLEHLNAVVADANDKKYFANWLDCSWKTATFFYYSLAPSDEDNVPRSNDWHGGVPSCAQQSAKGYGSDSKCIGINDRRDADNCYDRGHMVRSGHMSFSKQAQRETYSMNNINPQQANFNQEDGAWGYAEKVNDNHRTPNVRQMIMGGIIYNGTDKDSMEYLEGHDVYVASWWWRVTVVHSTDSPPKLLYSWKMPNNKNSVWENPDTKENIMDEEYFSDLKELAAFIREHNGYTDFDFNYDVLGVK
eukprot:Nk52_evm25s628 gene=Nk52_evmTU25s628